MKLSRPGPCGPAGTPRISRPFKQLSRSRGQVTHVILTRSPLNPPPKTGAGPFDLHVLSTPPAFVLSQDQTLQTKPNPNPNRPGPVQQKPEKKQPRTQPDTPHNPPTPRKPQPNKGPSTRITRRHEKHRTEKNNTRKPPANTSKNTANTNRKPGTTRPPPQHSRKPGDAHTPNPTTNPDHSQNRTTQEPGARRRTPDPPPTKRKQATDPPPTKRKQAARARRPRTPEPPATRHPPQQAGAERTRNTGNPRSPRKHDGQARTTPKKERNPNPPAKTTNTKHDTLSRSQTTHPPGLHDPHPRTASSRKRSRSIGQPHVRSRFRTGAGGNRSPTTFQSSASVGSLDLSIPARAGENITHRRGGGQTERR